jgi:hypothetical protein
MDENGLSPLKWIWANNVTWTQNETEVSLNNHLKSIAKFSWLSQMYNISSLFNILVLLFIH